jgi:hypothetical protein
MAEDSEWLRFSDFSVLRAYNDIYNLSVRMR